MFNGCVLQAPLEAAQLSHVFEAVILSAGDMRIKASTMAGGLVYGASYIYLELVEKADAAGLSSGA